jgi:hypothetical protein
MKGECGGDESEPIFSIERLFGGEDENAELLARFLLELIHNEDLLKKF